MSPRPTPTPRVSPVLHIISLPLNILTFLQLTFKLFIFYFPLENFASILLKSFSEFFFSLLPKWSTFALWFSYVHCDEVEKCSFLTNDSAWFKVNFSHCLVVSIFSMNALVFSLTWNFGNLFHKLLAFLPYFFFLRLYASLKFLKQNLFALAKIVDMPNWI